MSINLLESPLEQMILELENKDFGTNGEFEASKDLREIECYCEVDEE